MARPMRRNYAHLSLDERRAYANAVRQIDLRTYGDGVSYWDKQDQIHQATHNHDGPSFMPWHRELCNRYERLLQQVDPSVALHYWDWTQDPRAASNAAGGTTDLCTDDTMGTANGVVAGTLAPLHNNDALAGSREATGNPADPPRVIRRNCDPGAPPVSSDATILGAGDGRPQADQWPAFRTAAESAHDSAHVFFGLGSNIRAGHAAFEDPFVFLLHANVDRLFAQWQTTPGEDWRLDPAQVYGSESNTTGQTGILDTMAPWDGTADFGASIPPWNAGSSEITLKNSRHPSVVAPPCYDTLPLSVTRVAPAPGQPMRFIDVPAGEQTARALRLRVRGCRAITGNAALAGDAAFSLLSATVSMPEPDAFGTHDLLVWVLFAAGSAGSNPSGTLTVTVPATGDTFTVPIEASVIARPVVAASLVLDRSGSMAAPSGVAATTRMDVLRSAAPLFVTLLDDADAVGVVRFDTDAEAAAAVAVAGAQIGGAGRAGALSAISTHSTNPAGMTAIGDGLEAAATQLDAVATAFAQRATVVFTDGHETEPKFIADVADLINSRVYAIGLGTADQLDPGALDDLVGGTGGYLLLTGNPGPDDQILLQKYFAQVVAGVTNAQIVVDPDGHVPLGERTAVPYLLTEADSRTDVIVLSPAAEALDVRLEAPDGQAFDASNGVTVVATPTYQVLRLALPTPITAGTWVAHLSVDRGRFAEWLRKNRDRQDDGLLGRIKNHGLPFTLAVQARSSVRLSVAVAQASRRPGSAAAVRAVLTQAGIALGRTAAVRAVVTDPSGSVSDVPLDEVDAGVFSGSVPTPTAGVYRVLVRAEGASLRGTRFTREELRTVGVWARGDDRPAPGKPPGGGVNWCEVLGCWLGDPSVTRFLQQQGLDSQRLHECLRKHCP